MRMVGYRSTAGQSGRGAGSFRGNAPAPGFETAYSTSFAASENPISESGRWQRLSGTSSHDLWQDVRTTGGNAVPAANAGPTGGGPGAGDYDDAYSRLTGLWGPDNQIITTVYAGAGAKECEHLHRCLDTGTTVRGYEFTFDISNNFAIVRWNAAADDFEILAQTAFATLNDGDKCRSRVVGQVLTMWVAPVSDPTNYTQVLTFTDNAAGKFTGGGTPGIGFFARTPLSLDFGWKDFSVAAFP